jgi:hypothetical protein
MSVKLKPDAAGAKGCGNADRSVASVTRLAEFSPFGKNLPQIF